MFGNLFDAELTSSERRRERKRRRFLIRNLSKKGIEKKFIKAIEARNAGLVENILDNDDIDLDFVCHVYVPPFFHEYKSPLEIAIDKGDLGIIESILKYKVDPDLGKYNSPLHRAVTNNNFNQVKLLLDYGANPVQIKNGKTPLDIALDFNNLFIADLLLNTQLIRIPKWGYTQAANKILCYDDWHRYVMPQIAIKLIENGVEKKSTHLLDAVRNNDLKFAIYLLNHSVPIHDKALFIATELENVDMVQLLLSYGVDPNKLVARYKPLLIHAIVNYAPAKIIDLLLEYGADSFVEYKKKDALYYAKKFHNAAIKNIMKKIQIKTFIGMLNLSLHPRILTEKEYSYITG